MENASKVYGCPYLRALLLFITLNSLVLVCVSELVFVLVDALWYSGRQQFKLGNKWKSGRFSWTLLSIYSVLNQSAKDKAHKMYTWKFSGQCWLENNSILQKIEIWVYLLGHQHRKTLFRGPHFSVLFEQYGHRPVEKFDRPVERFGCYIIALITAHVPGRRIRTPDPTPSAPKGRKNQRNLKYDVHVKIQRLPLACFKGKRIFWSAAI